MKKVSKVLICIFCVLFIAAIIYCVFKVIQLDKLSNMSSEEMLEVLTKENSNVKVSIGVLKDGKSSFRILGQNMKEEENVSYDYEIGSISKTFLALMMSEAISEGKINIEDNISKYLDLESDIYYPTIKRLLTHTSGYSSYYFDSQMIDNRLSGANDFYNISKSKMLDKVKSVYLKDKDYKFNYSNFGISVLGQVLEKVYNKDYTSLMSEYIKENLKLENTSVATCKGNLDSYWTWDKDDGYIPAGAIISNVYDMTKYVELYLNSDKRYVAKTYEPQSHIDASNFIYKKLGINMDEIGMTWIIDSKNDFVWHNGATGNFNSFVAFNRAKNIGVVVLVNTPPNEKIPSTVIGMRLMKELCE